jgi:hypothetical protein
MLSWSNVEKAKYIRGFADGEGGPRFYKRKGIKEGHLKSGQSLIRGISISNSDFYLLNTVGLMLTDFGIKSHIYLDVKKGDKKATMNAWILRILDKESIKKFTEIIGFSNPVKQDILYQILASYRKV